MTPPEEAEFIRWWREGLSLKDIAARLGIPPGTVSSRAAALRRQGVALDKRPQGGAYPSQRVRARQEGPPADRPPSTIHCLPWTLHRLRSIIFVRTSRRS